MFYKIHPDKVYKVVFAIFLVGAVVKYSAELACGYIWDMDRLEEVSLSVESAVSVSEAASRYAPQDVGNDHI
jgi:hypothetical protein